MNNEPKEITYTKKLLELAEREIRELESKQTSIEVNLREMKKERKGLIIQLRDMESKRCADPNLGIDLKIFVDGDLK